MVPSTPILRSRDLRERSTKAERRLWRHIRDRQLRKAKFRRQHPVGRYIVDFFARKERLIVELDGGQHAESGPMKLDAFRTRELERRGFRVLRFWNGDVLQNLPGVLEAIQDALALPPLPLPARRGEGRVRGGT